MSKEEEAQEKHPWVRVRKLVLHFGTELVVIFLGITLGFLFEEWRQEQADLGEERRLLEIIHLDVRVNTEELKDDTSYAFVDQAMTELLMRAARSPYSSTEGKLNGELLERCGPAAEGFRVQSFATFDPKFELRSATYEYIISTNGWRLLNNEELENGLVVLFELFDDVTHAYQRMEQANIEMRARWVFGNGGLGRTLALPVAQRAPFADELERYQALQWSMTRRAGLALGQLEKLDAMLLKRLAELEGK